jgi:hypothetical protein
MRRGGAAIIITISTYYVNVVAEITSANSLLTSDFWWITPPGQGGRDQTEAGFLTNFGPGSYVIENY